MYTTIKYRESIIAKVVCAAVIVIVAFTSVQKVAKLVLTNNNDTDKDGIKIK